nr:uncharacterized mitochondrial protein AtMg00810-like [Tanacetum cinerariifolium]
MKIEQNVKLPLILVDDLDNQKPKNLTDDLLLLLGVQENQIPNPYKCKTKVVKQDWLFDIDALIRIMNYEPIVADVGTFNFLNEDEDDDAVADINNLDITIQVSLTPTTRIHKDHPLDQVIRDFQSATQTRNMTKNLEEHGFVSTIQQRKNHKDLQNCLFACFLSQEEPKKSSSMGELTFFLGLQVKQKNDDIFISQDKYVAEILREFRFTKVKNASTPMETQKPLLKDEYGEEVDVHMYRTVLSTDVAKTINGETQIHARVDGKKVIISEASIRRDLQFADEEGVDCLPNSTIFKQLASMGPKTTAWKEFSSTVASAIIYLATNENFNFSKWIFDSMCRNLDNFSGKFLMYPRNMRRIGKGFPGRITPLFPAIVPSDPMEHVVDEVVHKELRDSLVRAATTASSLEAEKDSGNTLHSHKDRLELNELMELCTNLQSRVIDLEKTKTTQANEIDILKKRVKKLERRNKSRTHKLKRLYKVGLTARVESSDNKESLGEDASKQGRRIDDIDDDEDITLEGYTLKQLKSFEFDKIQEMFDRAFKRVKTFEDFRTELVQGQEKEKRAREELIQNRAKKQKVEDDKETTTLKQLIEIIPDKEEVAINSIPLAVKSPGIVDWKIYKEGKKRYFQIIRADEKSKMYMFFNQILENFDREDLEDLYKLVKVKYGSTRPVEDFNLLL